MKAAIYIRVSTPGQAAEGESLDLQKERLIEYVKNHGWELYKTYEDGGFSGKDVNRPAFQKMMRDAEFKKFDVLVVYKIDRLSRSVLDFHTTMKFLEKQVISFVSVTQQFDTTTSMGRLMLNILIDFANFEREINVDRSIDSYLKRLQDGINSGAVPYGYKREGKEVIIVLDEAEKVKKIFSLSLQGLSMNEVARETGFTNYHVRSILTNPFYCGYLVRKRDKNEHRIKENEWKWHKGKHKSIITEELWRDVTDMRKRKMKIITKKTTSLFSHLIYCPYCKHNLCSHSRTKKEKIIFYYECDRIRIDDKSCGQYLREEALESILINYVNKVFEIHLPAKREIDIDDEVANIDRKINKIVRMVEADLLSIEEGKLQAVKLKEQKAKLLTSKIIEVDFSKIEQKLKQLKQIYPYMTREEKSRLWHLLIEKMDAQKSKIVVHWRFGTKYTFRRAMLTRTANRTDPCVVAAGGFEPSTLRV